MYVCLCVRANLNPLPNSSLFRYVGSRYVGTTSQDLVPLLTKLKWYTDGRAIRNTLSPWQFSAFTSDNYEYVSRNFMVSKHPKQTTNRCQPQNSQASLYCYYYASFEDISLISHNALGLTNIFCKDTSFADVKMCAPACKNDESKNTVPYLVKLEWL